MLKYNDHHSSRNASCIYIDLFLYTFNLISFVCASRTISENRHPVAIIRRDERERGKSGRPRVTFIFIRW